MDYRYGKPFTIRSNVLPIAQVGRGRTASLPMSRIMEACEDPRPLHRPRELETAGAQIWIGHVELSPSAVSAAQHHGDAESGIYNISGDARFYTGEQDDETLQRWGRRCTRRRRLIDSLAHPVPIETRIERA
jgi:hypothetical protein